MKSLALRGASSSDSEFAYSTKRSAFKQYVEEVWVGMSVSNGHDR
jgi:hypothetical protein